MAKKKAELGLGRGLNALLGDPVLQDQGEGSVSLPISQVEPGLNQPRKRFDPEALAELADSIREHGIIQPLTVRRLSSGYYQIIAGERRWRAAKQAGLDEVPAVIIEADDRKVMEIGLIENLQREDLNPAEEARGYQVLMNEYGMTQDQVAQRMGKSRPAGGPHPGPAAAGGQGRAGQGAVRAADRGAGKGPSKGEKAQGQDRGHAGHLSGGSGEKPGQPAGPEGAHPAQGQKRQAGAGVLQRGRP